VAAELSRGLVLPPRPARAAPARRARRRVDGADRRRRRGRTAARDRRRQHGRRAAREGAQDRDLHADDGAAVGRRRDARPHVRRDPVREDLGRRRARREALDLRVGPPLPRGLHRAAEQAVPGLPRRAVVPRAAAARAGDGEEVRDGHDAGGEEGGGGAHPAVRRERRLPLRDVRRHRIAGPGRRGARRRHGRSAGGRLAARRGRRPEDAVGARLRVPRRASRVAVPERAERRRRPPGERAGPPPAVGQLHALRLLGQVRSGRDHAGAGPPHGDQRLLRCHHLLHEAHAQAGGDGARERGGRRLGEVPARRLRQGRLDLPRRARPRGPAARDRQRADRPGAAPELAGLPADPQQRALPGREEEAAQDL
ncbi:MAG: hypothetical protein AVDCRST_MAG65-319, partial [uncultured Solirubrobacteraceae bacterium]